MDTVVIDEEAAYKSLLRKLKGTYTSIVTCGRGGLGVAQRVAYKLGLQVEVVPASHLYTLQASQLFVDDIVCSGATIGSIPRSVDIATLVHRKSAFHKPTFTGLVYEGEEYIKFSWEK